VPDPINPQSLNRFAYVYNNPLKYTDPSGHCADGDTECEFQKCIDAGNDFGACRVQTGHDTPLGSKPGNGPLFEGAHELAEGFGLVGDFADIGGGAASFAGAIVQDAFILAGLVQLGAFGVVDGPQPGPGDGAGLLLLVTTATEGIAAYNVVMNPIEDRLGWVDSGCTIVADVLDGYTYIDRGSTPSGWNELVIGQDTVRDFVYALAGQIWPEGNGDFVINALDVYVGLTLKEPTWEVRVPLTYPYEGSYIADYATQTTYAPGWKKFARLMITNDKLKEE